MTSKLLVSLAVALALIAFAASQSIPDQDWGYVTVRPKAHMFWCVTHSLNDAVGLLIVSLGGCMALPIRQNALKPL